MTIRTLAPKTLLLLLLLGCTSQAGTSFREAATIEPSYNKETKTLSVEVKLIDGIHAYAEGEKIGKPVDLKIKDQNGWRASELQLPKGEQVPSKFQTQNVILKGSFMLKAKVQGGRDTIFGEVLLQLCSNEACDRPRTHSFSVMP